VIQPDQAIEIVSTIGRNVDKIVDLVNSILFLQELDLITPDFEPVMVGQVVAEAVANVSQKAAETNLSLKIEIAPHLPLVNGDARGLEQAIAVLLDNAIKFSPEGGEIHVSVSRQDRSVDVEIADPGVGIPEDQLEQLFEPFHRVDSIAGHLFGGVGLGLPIAKQLVELHGGRIWAERRSQGGSKFTVSLPILTA
jgi:signal transduction histidine kinase